MVLSGPTVVSNDFIQEKRVMLYPFFGFNGLFVQKLFPHFPCPLEKTKQQTTQVKTLPLLPQSPPVTHPLLLPKELLAAGCLSQPARSTAGGPRRSGEASGSVVTFLVESKERKGIKPLFFGGRGVSLIV